MARWLIERGVPEAQIIVEDKSTSTEENLLFARRLLEERVSAVEGVRVTRLADGRAEVKCDVLFPAGYTAEDILRTLKGMPAIRSVEMHHPG